jgi:chromosome segregation ATPase
MIPTSGKRTTGNLGRKQGPIAGWLWVGLWLPLLSVGCVTDRETTISRAARQREMDALRIGRDRQIREQEILRYEVGERSAKIAETKAESVQLASQVRALHAGLLTQLGPLQAAEQDLEAAKARAVAIQKELEPLRALEHQLAERDQKLAELRARLVSLDAEVAAAEKAVAEKSAALAPHLQELQQKLAAAQVLEKALADAQAAIAAAAPVLIPPPPPPPPPPAEAKK